MRYLMITLCLAALGCGGSNKAATTPAPEPEAPVVEETSPPWEALEEAERNVYEVELGCPTATTMVNLAALWPLSTSKMGLETNPYEAKPGVWMEYLEKDDSNSAFFLYHYEGEERVNSAVVITWEGQDLFAVDYYLARALLTKEVTAAQLDANYSEVEKRATGEYFCLLE